MDHPPVPPDHPWLGDVRVTADASLSRELQDRYERRSSVRSVWVTDLLDVRSAFYRAILPVPTSPARQERREEGRAWHARIGRMLGPADQREVRVRRGGIVGQIDLLVDRPIELKTTASPSTGPDLVRSRPSYFEQLGMYSAILERPEARLILVETPEPPAPPRAIVLDCRFEEHGRIWTEMEDRAHRLRSAWESRDGSSLPACPWRSRGCELEGLCGCTGTEAAARFPLTEWMDAPHLDEEESARLTESLVTAGSMTPPDGVRRFRDYLYPRRAYFERTLGIPSVTGPGPAPERSTGLWRDIGELLEAGPAGEVTRVWPKHGPGEERILCFRGDPFLIKTPRYARPLWAAEILRAQPQYVVDLAARCASLDRATGWLIIGCERSSAPADRILAFEVRFPDLPSVERTLEATRNSLEAAVRARDPRGLPACPGWMFTGCAYQSTCGCGTPTA
jgi:hypothetical protein